MREKGEQMISRMILSLVLITVIASIGGLVVLAAWDVPVQQTQVEKELDNSKFLQKSS